MFSTYTSPYSSCFHIVASKPFLCCLLKISEMRENVHQLGQHRLVVQGIMEVHREEGVFPSVYPCSEFMNATWIMQDFHTLMNNAGLEHFLDDEPRQYAKLTMSIVQDFCFELSSPNPVVRYKIYNIPVILPFSDFCAAIKVPHWRPCEKIRG